MNINVYYGRFQPIHRGHIFTIKQIVEKDNDAVSYLATSGTFNNKSDPIIFERKISFLKRAVESLGLDIKVWDTPVSSIYDLIRDLCFLCQEQGGGVVTLFCGSDRLEAYQKLTSSLVPKYQARSEILDVSFKVEKVVNRDDTLAYSATLMRQHVKDNNFEDFLENSLLPKDLAFEIFEELKKGMGLVETEQKDPYFVTELMAKKVSKTINPLTIKPNNLYYVGGCVRDEIMGLKPKDLDLVTDMYFKDYAKLFNTTDIRYRGSNVIVVPIIDGVSYETACLSKDVNLIDRLKKSDLTMNAIAKNILTGEIIDPLKGRLDIEENILRNTPFMIEAFNSGKQPVAVLRTIRFYATTDMILDPESLLALKKFSLINKGRLKVTDAQFDKEFQKVEKANRIDKFTKMMKGLELS